MIPEAAVEAAAMAHQDALAPVLGRVAWDELKLGKGNRLEWMRTALEAAAPHMLSHEREETRLAHLDAVVNARTVDKLNSAIERVELACEAMDAGVQMRAGDPRTKSFAAQAIRAAIREALQ